MDKPDNLQDDDLDDTERKGLERMEAFLKLGAAYAYEQATRPMTIAYAVSASPVSLLSWCVASGFPEIDS